MTASVEERRKARATGGSVGGIFCAVLSASLWDVAGWGALQIVVGVFALGFFLVAYRAGAE